MSRRLLQPFLIFAPYTETARKKSLYTHELMFVEGSLFSVLPMKCMCSSQHLRHLHHSRLGSPTTFPCSAASAISIIWKFWNAAKRERFKHLAKDGEIDSRTAWMCFRFNALRALLTTVHVFCILACIWFVLMLCALVALLVLLFVGQKTAGGALTFIQTAETVSLFLHSLLCIVVCSILPACIKMRGVSWVFVAWLEPSRP